MDANEAHELPNQGRIRPRQIRRLGVLILVAGLIAAATAYFRARPDDEAERLFQAGTLLSGNARQYTNEMRNLGGKANELAADVRNWFARQWQGRRRARTLAVLTGGAALGCFVLAHLLGLPAAPEDAAKAEPTPPARPAGRPPGPLPKIE